jgi:hypothetical protein
MRRFIEGADRGQATLFRECLEDWICEDNPVRVIDVFVDRLDLETLRFDGVAPEVTGRPSYHPSVLLKLYASPRTAIATADPQASHCNRSRSAALIKIHPIFLIGADSQVRADL